MAKAVMMTFCIKGMFYFGNTFFLEFSVGLGGCVLAGVSSDLWVLVAPGRQGILGDRVNIATHKIAKGQPKSY